MDSNSNHSAPDGIAQYLSQQRWFADKGRAITSVSSSFRAEVVVESDPLSIELLQIAFDRGSLSTYLLIRDPQAPDRDCLERPQVRGWLIDGFEERRELEGTTGWLTWSGPLAERVESGQSRVFRGEQSNTSIVYGKQVMLKLFRKIQPGQNPEVEIGDHLTRHTDFKAFPKLLGTVAVLQGDKHTTVACVQQFIHSVGDAWSWLLDNLASDTFADDAVAAMRQLGRRTAELHLALSSGTEPAFVPERIDASLAAKVYGEARVELDETISALRNRDDLDAMALGEALNWRLDDLRMLEGTFRIRIHGDYHLGQVLRTANEDFAILDFEGEPSRTLAERREKASPLRDVAGMLRSIDYLTEAVHRQNPGAASDGTAEWNQKARQAFADGYTASVAGWPLFDQAFTPDTWRRLTSAFEVHKALYETRYELGNRPDWVDIPLGGLRRLASQSS